MPGRIGCEWEASGIAAVVANEAPVVVVVCDVLIFSIAVVAALDAGVWVHPHAWGDGAAAAAYAATRGAMVAGRRGEAEPNLSPGSLARLPAPRTWWCRPPMGPPVHWPPIARACRWCWGLW